MPRRLSRSRTARLNTPRSSTSQLNSGWSGTAQSDAARSGRLRSDDALSEVIGFILIIAILMIFLSLWMVYVVPAEGRQQEIEHMNYVRNWFTQYKITADSLWVNEIENLALSNSIVLGSQGAATQAGGLFLPIMSPVGSTGTIAVRNVSADGGGVERIEVRVEPSWGSFTPFDVPIGRLEFSSTNNYWISQTYYYQMGGVFLRQPTSDGNGTVTRLAPLITYNTNDNSARLTFIRIHGIGDDEVGGKGPIRIDTTLESKGSWTNLDPPGPREVVLTFVLQDESAAKGYENYLKEIGNPTLDISRTGNMVTIRLDILTYSEAEYGITLQSVASLVE